MTDGAICLLWVQAALYVGMCCCSCAYSNTLSLCLQQVRTGDLGGYATSDEFTRAVIANLAA